MSSNLTRYGDSSVVDFYSQLIQLEPAERLLYDKYIKTGARVLDLGVGAGRTTPYLSSRAGQYLGADYSPTMVAACQKHFPNLSFVVADACDLSRFADNSFDSVVFSFNGIDCIEADSMRHAFLAHCIRIIPSGGSFIFSSHNSRYLTPNSLPTRWPVRRGWRWCRNIVQNRQHLWRMFRSGVFLKEEGYIFEPLDGGLKVHYASKEKVNRELSTFGFRVVEILPYGFPQEHGRFSTPWYHYACIK